MIRGRLGERVCCNGRSDSSLSLGKIGQVRNTDLDHPEVSEFRDAEPCDEDVGWYTVELFFVTTGIEFDLFAGEVQRVESDNHQKRT